MTLREGGAPPSPEGTLLDQKTTVSHGPAWDRAVRTYHRRVVVSLLAMGVRLDQAEEIAHRAWARIFEQREAGKLERLELPGIVIRQARFFALDAARRRTRHDQERTFVGAFDPADPAADPEQRLLGREQLDRATAALESCTPRTQEVFRVVYENPAMPHAEVARRLGLSVQRVRQILWEVRRTVRQALGEDQS